MNEWEALLPDEQTPPRRISTNDIIAERNKNVRDCKRKLGRDFM